MDQGSWSGSGGLRKVVAIAGKRSKKKPKKKPTHTVNSGLKVRY
jgi:hypothetical protein